MEITIKGNWGKELQALLSAEDARVFDDRYMYRLRDNDSVKINAGDWDIETIDKVIALLDSKSKQENGKPDLVASRSKNALMQWKEVKRNPSSSVIKNLQSLTFALKSHISQVDNKWVYCPNNDGNIVPHLVTSIEYHPAVPRNETPAYVEMKMIHMELGDSREGDGVYNLSKSDKRITFYSAGGLTCEGLLAKYDIYLSTDARTTTYNAEIEKFMEMIQKEGAQLDASGQAYISGGWYCRGWKRLGNDETAAKVVIDVHETKTDTSGIECSFWGEENAEGNAKTYKIPIHPYIPVFELENHDFYRIHVNQVSYYVYNDNADANLVLPKEVKEFLTTLIQYSADIFEDIVAGKSGGTICLLEGGPGIGKTLTAEVYSEKMHRPLYRVQSSQLGLSPKEVEESLKEVLQRADRWNAILLIDEADVYIRARSSDLIQNAIVGVFLRLLEYYKGVLFMTTNRGSEVDDAIVSRMTARFIYEKPTRSAQKEIWKALVKHNAVRLTDEEIDAIVTYHDMSGRDIKNALKLCLILSRNTGLPITTKTVDMVVKFRPGVGK